MEELEKANQTINVLIGGYIFTSFLFLLWIRTLSKYIYILKECLEREKENSKSNFDSMLKLHKELIDQEHKIETYDNLFPNENERY